MENSQLQHLGKLLTGGEDNAKLAREVMLGQGIWNPQGLCDCLNAVADQVNWITAYKFICNSFGPFAVTCWQKDKPIRPMAQWERLAEIARIQEIDSRYRPNQI